MARIEASETLRSLHYSGQIVDPDEIYLLTYLATDSVEEAERRQAQYTLDLASIESRQ